MVVNEEQFQVGMCTDCRHAVADPWSVGFHVLHGMPLSHLRRQAVVGQYKAVEVGLGSTFGGVQGSATAAGVRRIMDTISVYMPTSLPWEFHDVGAGDGYMVMASLAAGAAVASGIELKEWGRSSENDKIVGPAGMATDRMRRMYKRKGCWEGGLESRFCNARGNICTQFGWSPAKALIRYDVGCRQIRGTLPTNRDLREFLSTIGSRQMLDHGQQGAYSPDAVLAQTERAVFAFCDGWGERDREHLFEKLISEDFSVRVFICSAGKGKEDWYNTGCYILDAINTCKQPVHGSKFVRMEDVHVHMRGSQSAKTLHVFVRQWALPVSVAVYVGV
jgi:hypothetical protein